MKTKVFFILFLMLNLSAFAQLDKNKKKFKYQLEKPIENSTAPSSDLPSLEYKPIFETNNDDYLKKYSILDKKEKPSKSILDESTDFKNPGDELKDKLNKEFDKEGAREDVFFGKFKVNTPTIKLLTRDFADPDGDKVQVILNQFIFEKVIVLDNSFKTTIIELREGDNLLDILALNQGLAGPNTATFAIYDANGVLLTQNNWNLITGVSAKFVIEYIKPINGK